MKTLITLYLLTSINLCFADSDVYYITNYNNNYDGLHSVFISDKELESMNKYFAENESKAMEKRHIIEFCEREKSELLIDRTNRLNSLLESPSDKSNEAYLKIVGMCYHLTMSPEEAKARAKIDKCVVKETDRIIHENKDTVLSELNRIDVKCNHLK